jgi:hypothetical protein
VLGGNEKVFRNDKQFQFCLFLINILCNNFPNNITIDETVTSIANTTGRVSNGVAISERPLGTHLWDHSITKGALMQGWARQRAR